MEEFIKILIYIHAFFGGIGLITGFGSIFTKKGSILHKKMGKLFSIGMIVSSLISIPIAWMPKHENLFLFLIGIFTIYLVLTGNRAIKLNNKDVTRIDYFTSASMLFFSTIMITLGGIGIIKSTSFSILYLFFGSFGIFLTIKDIVFYKSTANKWLSIHISKMIGAFIASITAFIIAGLGIGSLIAWTLPTILGTCYIIYWKKKTTQTKIK